MADRYAQLLALPAWWKGARDMREWHANQHKAGTKMHDHHMQKAHEYNQHMHTCMEGQAVGSQPAVGTPALRVVGKEEG